MIVRDESRVIERCLTKVKPYIDSWAITDTGSEDDTMEIIQRVLSDVPGKLYQEPWVNFGVNRTIAFENAKEWGRYSLIFDADDIFDAEEYFSWPDMDRSHYEMDVQLTGTSFAQARLLKTSLDWKWVGPVHEYPELLDAAQANMPPPMIGGASIVSLPDGNRRSLDDSVKYLRDAELIEKWLEDHPDDPRQMFYLAQSYRDCGKKGLAIDAYRRRSQMINDGWVEEAWYSQFQVGVLLDALADESDSEHAEILHLEAMGAYLKAYNMRPQRIEPLVTLARNLRMRGDFRLAYLFISQVAYAERPKDRLFIDSATYDWFALDEYAVCCYLMGLHEEALKANRKLLEVIPEEHIKRIRANIKHSQSALSETK